MVALFLQSIATKYMEKLVGSVMYLLQVAFALTVVIVCQGWVKLLGSISCCQLQDRFAACGEYSWGCVRIYCGCRFADTYSSGGGVARSWGDPSVVGFLAAPSTKNK
jgi:hypothetical protein